MNKLSRRQFIMIAGAVVTAPALGRVAPMLPATPVPATSVPVMGRALRSTILRTPTGATTVVPAGTILSDIRMRGDFLLTPDGLVPRWDVQPIEGASPNDAVEAHTPPFWAEVGLGSADIHIWAATDAPLVTQIGFGGVLRVVDQLPVEAPSGAAWWYALQDEAGNAIGWSYARNWRPLTEADPPREQVRIELYRDTRELRVYDGNVLALLQTHYSAGASVVPGEYVLGEHRISTRIDDHHGASWVTSVDGLGEFVGVYWHNEFGENDHPGPAIQLTPRAARWLYDNVAVGSRVIVR